MWRAYLVEAFMMDTAREVGDSETGNGEGDSREWGRGAYKGCALAGLEVARGCIHNLPRVANSSPTATDVAVVPPPN